MPKIPKFLIFAIPTLLLTSAIGFFIHQTIQDSVRSQGNLPIISPFAELSTAPVIAPNKPATSSAQLSDPFHLLLLGLDKRYPQQESYRTDTIMIVSLLNSERKILLTSIENIEYVN